MLGLWMLAAMLPPCHVALRPAPLHHYMTQEELHYYFGTSQPSNNYELAIIKTAKTPHVGKRSGADPAKADSKVLKFSAMGQDYSLNLVPNKRLLAPYAVIAKRSHPRRSNSSLERLIEVDWLDDNDSHWDDFVHDKDLNDRDMSMDELLMDRSAGRRSLTCQYLHAGDDLVAAVSLCNGEAQGIVLAPSHSLEIMPLNSRLKRMLDLWKEDYNETHNGTIRTSRQPRTYHIVKRLTKDYETRPFLDQVKELFADQDNTLEFSDMNFDRNGKKQQRAKRAGGEKVMETAVFLDSAAYSRFADYYRKIGKTDVDGEVKRLVLGYMNGIQAIYMLPSLGDTIRISIVRLELWKSDPADMYNYQGDREPLLDSFCKYQERLNPGDDSDPGHWDLALYVSGLNFYAADGQGRKNGVTMGLARVGGMCHKPHACVIGELGVTTDTGKPYPSAGFTAAYVMAHEIGHNLGMSHDHTVGCDRDGFIMSESRGSNGESQWSSCSVNSLKTAISKGDLSCLNDNNAKQAERLDLETNVYPGEVWTANQQCQTFLLDSDARIDHTDKDFAEMCAAIKCRTPVRDGYYRAGPALEGTACGEGKWCRNGDCVKNDKPALSSDPGSWSDWSFSGCMSGCTPQSMGYRTKRRSCDQKNSLVHTPNACKGPTTGMDFCDDTSVCTSRKEIDKYASEQCALFSSYVPNIDKAGIGVQVKYSSDRTWQSCAIFCKRSDTGGWYTPRLELNDLPLSAYLPDGTLCHQDGGTKYYCQKNSCLEKDSRGAKQDQHDLDILFNAAPDGDGDRETPKELQKYFTLDENKNPVGGNFAGVKGEEDKEEEWGVKDYI